jgi:hypothetical protein
MTWIAFCADAGLSKLTKPFWFVVVQKVSKRMSNAAMPWSRAQQTEALALVRVFIHKDLGAYDEAKRHKRRGQRRVIVFL